MRVVVETANDATRRWLVRLADVAHPAVPAVATAVDDALRATGRASGVRWYTREDWSGARTGWSSYPV